VNGVPESVNDGIECMDRPGDHMNGVIGSAEGVHDT
jgi:hypothetical protein